jgi:hypothetical protein
LEQLRKWKECHPNWLEDDELMEEYMLMIRLVAGSASNEEIERDKKEILRGLSKKLNLKSAMSSLSLM